MGELVRLFVDGQHDLPVSSQLEVLADDEGVGERGDHALDRLEGGRVAVDAVAGSSTGVADGSGLPLEIGVIDRPAPGRASIWVIPKNSVATPCTWTRSPTAIAAGQPPRQNTKSPSEVAAESSTSPSSSCRKNPSSASWFVNVLVTMASAVTAWLSFGVVASAPWISEIGA